MYALNHIGIKVQDMKKSIDFYCNILGCTIEHTYKDTETELVFLECGHSIIELVYKPKVEPPKNTGIVEHIAFTVTSLDEAIQMLNNNNIKLLLDSPKEIDSKLVMFFEGPNGEKLEFVQILK